MAMTAYSWNLPSLVKIIICAITFSMEWIQYWHQKVKSKIYSYLIGYGVRYQSVH